MARKFFRCCLLLSIFLLVGRMVSADDKVEFQRDVEFSNPDGEHLKLDLARPKMADKLAPAVVCIHGGGWKEGNKAPWDAYCRTLAVRGYVAVSVSYRLAPKYKFPAQLDDVKAAVRWLRENADRLKIDPQRIGAIGDSAGGHLAMMLGTTGDLKRFDNEKGGPTADSGENRSGTGARTSGRVRCVVDFYGPSDLTRSDKVLPVVEQMVTDLVGSDIEHGRRQHALASPLYWVTPDTVPMLLVHGTKDPLVPYQQAVWMRDRLKSADVEVELLTIEGAGHGFRGDDLKRAITAATEFFDKHLKGKE